LSVFAIIVYIGRRFFFYSKDRLGEAMVNRLLGVMKLGYSLPGQVRPKTERLTPATFLISVHHLRTRAGLVGRIL